MSLFNDNGTVAEFPTGDVPTGDVPIGPGGNFVDPFAAMGAPSFTGGAGGNAGPSRAQSDGYMASPFIFQPGGSTAERVASWIVPALLAGAVLWLTIKK